MPRHKQSLGPTLEELSTDPKRHLVRSNPADDLRMLMPHHGELRDKKFAEWNQKHGKSYSSHDETRRRSSIFHSNLRYINAANRRGKSYSLAANHMADWTRDELSRLNGRKQVSLSTAGGPQKTSTMLLITATMWPTQDRKHPCPFQGLEKGRRTKE